MIADPEPVPDLAEDVPSHGPGSVPEVSAMQDDVPNHDEDDESTPSDDDEDDESTQSRDDEDVDSTSFEAED